MQTITNRRKTWQKSSVANLYSYAPTGVYYARPRIKGKVKVKCLNTDKLSVAKLRLGDFLKEEHRKAESINNTVRGKMTVGDAIDVFKTKLEADKSLKPRTKDYRLERLGALTRSWPNLDKTDIGKIHKSDCEAWADRFGKAASPTAFNNTVGTLRMILDIGVELGARYDNPARLVSKHQVRLKKLELPSKQQFIDLIKAIETTDGGWKYRCADLVRFLAYGGFRKGEANKITWADCDFEKGAIRVAGDAITGTKNWLVRHVPMIEEMKTLLERLRQERPEAKPSESVMLIAECQGALTRACKTIGIKRITHHDLRHLFATLCIESGVDIPTVSKWLGHKDGGALAMKVYGHLRDEHSSTMAKKVSFQPAIAMTQA